MWRFARIVTFAGLAALAAPALALSQATVDYPGVALLQGANGTVWRSEAVLYNPGASAMTVRLELVPRGSGTVTASRDVPLAPGTAMFVENVYDALGAGNGAGTLLVSGGALAWIRTFNQGQEGSFGQEVPAVLQSTGLPGQTVLFPLKTAADPSKEPRSNLILENLEERPITVTVRSGTLEKSWIVQPGAMIQIDRIGRALGLPAGVAVIAVAGEGRWAGFVSTIDPYSGDPTTVLGRRSAGDGEDTFAGVAHLAGANGTRWRSELIVHNPGDAPEQLRVELVPRGSTEVIARRGIELDPGATLFWSDIYEEMRAADGAGSLKVYGSVVAWVRTYNVLQDGATMGQEVPPACPETCASADRKLVLPVSNPADSSTGFRSNILLQNLGDADASCILEAGASTASLRVPGETYIQVDRVAEHLSPDPPQGQLALLLSCDGPVAAFVTTIDPQTGDPTTVTGMRLDELSLAAPRITAEPEGAEVAQGAFHELAVGVEGDGPLAYQWYRGLQGSRDNPVSGAVGARVRVGPVMATTDYWVEVENPGGRTSSSTARLKVDPLVTPVPLFEPPPGVYSGPVDVHLSCPLTGARIHYTVDGSEPTESSPVYAGESIHVSGHVTGRNDPDPGDQFTPLTMASLEIRAVAEADGLQPSPVSGGAYVIDAVDTAFDVPYGNPPAVGGSKHTLDIYQPRGSKGTPVLFFVHGGAWKQGDKNIYLELGNTFAGRYGFTTVVANYELSAEPWNAVFPEHIEDVADAFAWTFRHIEGYGGNPQDIWLFGQSAGGHLVSLLATDGSYLEARGLSTSLIRGTVSMSGIYDLQDMVQYPLNPLGLGSNEVLQYKALMLLVFGSYERAILDSFSPSRHTDSGQPPFRLIWAWEDMAGFPEEGQRFYDQIVALDGPAVDRFVLLESDIPQEVLDLDLGGHYEEIYAINTRDWNSVSARAVASFVDPAVAFPESER